MYSIFDEVCVYVGIDGAVDLGWLLATGEYEVIQRHGGGPDHAEELRRTWVLTECLPDQTAPQRAAHRAIMLRRLFSSPPQHSLNNDRKKVLTLGVE